MCGIAGIFSQNKNNINHGLIKSMTDAIAHRGPDGEGHFVSENICFGHRRLAILDLSEHGKQPMFSDDGKITITFNGEI
jgi:asparagine synthase (glutamine-hydrolysing)